MIEKIMLELFGWIALGASGLVTAGVYGRLRTSLISTKAPRYTSTLGQEVDLPSVSICIPARNEQHALTTCLEKVLASSYQRLEILVLDDVSGDDTSALIKSFASEGVRFIKGAPLQKGWIGKNHALQGLLEQASGTYILFIDVDTHLSPLAIENMVRTAMNKNLDMVSALPRREDGWRMSVLFSPLRYVFELIAHRKGSPAASSSAWLIRRDRLMLLDGFDKLRAITRPESALAAHFSAQNRYGFVTSTAEYGVSYQKKWSSQLATSTRLLYPLLNRSLALCFGAVVLLCLTLVPYGVIMGSFLGFSLSPFHSAISLALIIFTSATYGSYTRRVWRKGWLVGAVLTPFTIVQEIILIISSVVQYKRGSVKWKGRPIQLEG